MRMRKVFIPVVIAAAVAAAAIMPSAQADTVPVPRTMTPVVAIHGFIGGDCPKTNPRGDMFGPNAYMWYFGGEWQRPYDPIAFYKCDTSGSDIGTHATLLTPIETISHDLAWYIYNTYSSKDQAVAAIGYSLGGLILRQMILQFSLHDPTYPPKLMVVDALTLATPHNGLAVYCGPTPTMCQEFWPGSAFINHLQTNQNPQGTGGTDWTVMGGGGCDPVPPVSALAMLGAHKWSYAPTSNVPCYTHTSYLADISTKTDMTVQYAAPGSNTLQTMANAPHSLAAIQKALDSGSW